MRINPYVAPLSPAGKEEKKESTSAVFGNLYRDAMNKVNQQQIESGIATQGLISGEIEDLHQVMIASEKAKLSLQLTVQITNKLIEAYKEITRMQI
ncbi:MAG: flagellar hook-basal body complex protein FliE [Bacillota bacterium]|nr:flagellar hook-basal body complex protein FliE [Bacillota bacterium]